MTNNSNAPIQLSCDLLSCGAWGPGFSNWQELSTLLVSNQNTGLPFNKPIPTIIPANERRRAPLIVKMAVETSHQAITHSGLPPQQVACVFGSGLGDTDITDYLCKALLTESKQLSPTKFHNSVHNTAAGYWTISTGCMQAANSIAAYRHTVGMGLYEGISQCLQQQTPVLLTFYDMAVHMLLSELFPCQHNVALSMVIAPPAVDRQAIAPLQLSLTDTTNNNQALINPGLEQIRQHNPAADLLLLMENIAKLLSHENSTSLAAAFPLSTGSAISITTGKE